VEMQGDGSTIKCELLLREMEMKKPKNMRYKATHDLPS